MTVLRVDIAISGRCALYLAAAVECSARRVGDLTRIVAEIRSIKYVRLNRKTAITTEVTGRRDDVPQTGSCAWYCVRDVEYSAH